MEQKPFFSILTVTKDNRRTLEETIQSVYCQYFSDLEHIVIDGASNDGTVLLLKEYEKKYPLKWMSENDRGIGDALNKGLSLARGQYVIVIQSDDSFIDQFSLEKAHHFISQHSADIFSFPVILKNSGDTEKIIKPIRLIWYNHFKFIFHHQGCFVRKEVFYKVGGFREHFSISMDYDFMYRAIKNGASVDFGYFPIAKMGGGGISSVVYNRVREDRQVQLLNEDNPLWRITQMIFYAFYFPYKRIQYNSMRKTR
jgi:glycosyltransferase involved in cell wall biosynthesis